MDVDEFTLDWGGNDDDEIIHVQIQQQPPRPKPFGTTDEATLSGAESLLALAAGAASGEGQDDDGSDVVSLGGGEDDLQELYAYQNRTHLGGGARDDPKQTSNVSRPAEGTNRETNCETNHNEQKFQKSPRAASPRSRLDSQNPNKSAPDELISDGKLLSRPNSQAKARTSSTIEPRSPSIVKIIPPTGSLALPPKPVAAPPTPYVRPSHPSIMSASSMAAPPRDREREFHDSAKKSRSHASPENDVLPPLAPNWEIRVARDGTQERYFYNTKTKQSTWSRSAASLQAPTGSASPHDNGKEIAQSSGKRSPLPHPATTNDSAIGRQTRSRPSRFDTVKSEANGSSSTLLSVKDRHYSPPRENGNVRQPRPVQEEPEPHRMRRDLSPANLPPYPVSHRANDRDVDVTGFDRPRGSEQNNRSPFNDGPPGRNGERRVDRSRSRSPGRGRWSNDTAASNAWGRDAPRLQTNEHRPEAPRPPPPQYATSQVPSQFRGAPQAARSSSVGREERSRYPPPNLDQSSFRTLSPPTPSFHTTSSYLEVTSCAGGRKTRSRDRRRSPPPPLPLPPAERPLKRGRSRSPEPRPSFRTSPSQAPPVNGRWGDADSNQTGRDRSNTIGGYTRDRPPHLSDSSPPFAPPPDGFKTGYRDEGSRGMDFDRENGAKRQKTFDSPDSAPARRLSCVEDARDSTNEDVPRLNRAKRDPLPPQSERYKEMASTTSAPPLPAPPAPPRQVVNGTGPPVAPSAPRQELLSKGPNLADFVQGARLPPPPPPQLFPPPPRRDFEDTRVAMRPDLRPPPPERSERSSESLFEERRRGKQWDREADRDREPERARDRPFHTDLPIGPRAMDSESEPSTFNRRGRSPPREQRSLGPGPRSHQLRGGDDLKRSFNNLERGFKEQDRSAGPRGGDNHFTPQEHPPSRPRYNNQQQQQGRPPFNPPPAGSNVAPAPRPRQSYPPEKESWPPVDSPRDAPREFLGADEREFRKNEGVGPSEESQQYRKFGNQRRGASFNATPAEPNTGFSLPSPPPRAPVSPQNHVRPLPDSTRRNSLQRNQTLHPTSSSTDERQFRHDENEALPPWTSNESAQNRSPRESRRAFSGSGNQNAKSDGSGSNAQPPPASHPRDRHDGFKSRFSRSPRISDSRPGPSESRGEESFQHSKADNAEAVRNPHNGQTPPFAHNSFPPSDTASNLHPDRARSFYKMPRQASPPPSGRGGVRIRRPNKFSDKAPQLYASAPGGGEPLNSPRPAGQNSLLHRLSGPDQPPRSQATTTPPLHQRVGPPPPQWNRPLVALRDRLDDGPMRSDDNFGHSGIISLLLGKEGLEMGMREKAEVENSVEEEDSNFGWYFDSRLVL
ncbi:hypothetical protein BU17DRAFT_100885 [Hysterangium stoloniferum]|nr:hypothetical protein BU17DRAFT_100885 [Hysterangium stoloniferum]